MFGKSRVSPVVPLNPSQINADVRIRGTINVSEPLVMAGQLDGDINADTLQVASAALVTEAMIKQSVAIDGRVLGSIVADGAHVNAKFTKEPVTNG